MLLFFLIALGEHTAMTEYTIVLSDQASKDMSDIYEYIKNTYNAPQTAIGQFNRIATAINTLSTFPERIKLMNNPYGNSKKIRQLLIDNYSIIFTIQLQKVFVVRVLYSSSNIDSKL